MAPGDPQPLNNGYVGLTVPKNSPGLQSTVNQSLSAANLPEPQASVVSQMVMNEYNSNSILTPNTGLSAIIKTKTGTLKSNSIENPDGTTTVTSYTVNIKTEVMAINMKPVGKGEFSQSQSQDVSTSSSDSQSKSARLSYSKNGFSIELSGSVSNSNATASTL